MKTKSLLITNVVFYAIQYSMSMFYFGYACGESSQYPLPAGRLDHIIYPAACLIFLLIGIYFVRTHEYREPKSYCIMASVTFLGSALLWGGLQFFYYRGQRPRDTIVDQWIFPGVLFVCAVIISVIYLICAVRAKRGEEST